jgi:hypothetical protein
MLIDYVLGQTGIILRVKIRNSSVSTGAGLTGLTSASSGLRISTIADNEPSAIAYTVASSTIETISTLGTYDAPTATKARFSQLDATNHPGVYEIQIANARFAVSGAKSLLVSVSGATSAAECDAVIPLRSVNPYDGAAFGLSRLDAAVTTRMATFTLPANFSLLSINGSGVVKANDSGGLAVAQQSVVAQLATDMTTVKGTVTDTSSAVGNLPQGVWEYGGDRNVNKVLGGGSGTIAGVGAWVLGETGTALLDTVIDGRTFAQWLVHAGAPRQG